MKLSRVAQVLLMILVLSPYIMGDSWMPPEVTTYVSMNGHYEFKVVPKFYGRDCPRSNDTCVGYFRTSDDNRVVWSRPLLNRVAPVHVLVANSGRAVVTFDEWHNMGYGGNVVVVYDSIGRILHSLALSQLLLPSQINRVPHSVSSIWWRRHAWLSDNDSTIAIQLNVPGADTSLTRDPSPSYRSRSFFPRMSNNELSDSSRVVSRMFATDPSIIFVDIY